MVNECFWLKLKPISAAVLSSVGLIDSFVIQISFIRTRRGQNISQYAYKLNKHTTRNGFCSKHILKLSFHYVNSKFTKTKKIIIGLFNSIVPHGRHIIQYITAAVSSCMEDVTLIAVFVVIMGFKYAMSSIQSKSHKFNNSILERVKRRFKFNGIKCRLFKFKTHIQFINRGNRFLVKHRDNNESR